MPPPDSLVAVPKEDEDCAVFAWQMLKKDNANDPNDNAPKRVGAVRVAMAAVVWSPYQHFQPMISIICHEHFSLFGIPLKVLKIFIVRVFAPH